jgi:hypothetical protein
VVPDSDEESVLSSDTEEEGVNPNDAVLVVGDLIDSDDYLLQVHRILNQRTHVVVDVLESDNNNFVVGGERILTMAAAQLLCVQYNNNL